VTKTRALNDTASQSYGYHLPLSWVDQDGHPPSDGHPS